MWAYEGRLWIFGGMGEDPRNGYLYQHGDVQHLGSLPHISFLSQMLQYDVVSKKWTDMKQSGSIPHPCDHRSARIKNTLWLYQPVSGKLYQLDLLSMHWSENTTSQLRPTEYLLTFSFTPIDDERIGLVYGVSLGETVSLEMPGDVWVLNVSTKTWTRHSSVSQAGMHCVVKDPHSCALFVVDGIHGFSKIQLWPEKQPKSLLWHALKAVDQQRGQTGMPGIPVHLQHKLLLPGEKITELGDESDDCDCE
jgi:hypothetical protein